MPNTPSDRAWPLPTSPWILRMTWSELLFAHWAVPPECVTPHLPAGLDVDTRDGQAWIGVVPFLMSDVAPRCCPAIPGVSRFLELNVRTYVTCEGKPGVWFFSLDAASRLAVRVARPTFNLNYLDARMSMRKRDSCTVEYESYRTHRNEPSANFDATYQSDGDIFLAKPGTLEYWLTARYCLYSADRQGRLYRGEIDHEPWKLSPARCELRTNTMGSPWQFELSGQPHTLVAQSINVRAWMATPLKR